MCGIAGILNLDGSPPPNLGQISGMLAPLRHRGPDEAGVYLDDTIAMGNVRLSIIGVGSGTQPIANEDRTLWIVYNGEAFNYPELRRELEMRGHRFATGTDTEIILHLYEEHGAEALNRINGQFAFAIWDSRRRELFLARDRMGVRPLYYYWQGKRLFFASECKSILTITGPVDLNMRALAQVFTFWSTLPGQTLFSNIRELPPGHFMCVTNRSCEPKRYWQIPFHEEDCSSALSINEASEELAELLEDAVRIRLRADVAIGAYLSGGLDSSIVTTIASRLVGDNLKTYSLGFNLEAFDETAYQQKLIDSLGVRHKTTLAEEAEIRRLLPLTIWHCETPLLRTAPVPLLQLARLVNSDGLKVVLSGEGADEIFGGYSIFKEAKVRLFWGKAPDSLMRPRLVERLYPYIFRENNRGSVYLHNFFAPGDGWEREPFFSHAIRWRNSGKNLQFLSRERLVQLTDYDPQTEAQGMLTGTFACRDLLSRAQVLEMEIFLANYLLSSQGDRVAMAHSVELRHPFLDYRLLDFAFRLPARWKIRGLNEKYLLKRAFRRELPASIHQRHKQPYRAPIGGLFRQGGSRDYVDDLLSEPALARAGYFQVDKTARFLRSYRSHDAGETREFQDMAFMGILSTQLLHHQFIDNFPWRPAPAIRLNKVVMNSICHEQWSTGSGGTANGLIWQKSPQN